MTDAPTQRDAEVTEVGSAEEAGPTEEQPPQGQPAEDVPHEDGPHEAHQAAGRSGQGRFGGAASAEPGGADEYDVARPPAAPRRAEEYDVALPPPEPLPPEGPAAVDEAAQEPEAYDVDVHPDTRRAAEHLEDLRRLQAEYVNYKKRVDRDRDLARDRGVAQVIEALLPVLDDIHAAREHGDLEGGPFAAIADKLEGILARFGVTSLGEKGQAFDPAIHEALMHVDADLPEDASTTTVVQVIQPGFKVGERIVRPARVSVADPR